MQTQAWVGRQKHHPITGNLVYGAFLDFEARPVDGISDPHLHMHCYVPNATYVHSKQRWQAAEFGAIKRQAPYYEAAFHARLAHQVQALGYATTRTAQRWEITGVPADLRQRFSQRTQVIEATAQAKGITDPVAKAALGATTRQHKPERITLAELRQRWLARLTEAEKTLLAQAGHQDAGGILPTPAQAVAYALQHALERHSVVEETRVLTEALRYGVGAVTPEEARTALTQANALHIARDGRWMVTTPEVLAEERALCRFVRTTQGTCPALGGSYRAGQRLAEHLPAHFSPGQRQAVRHVLTSFDRVMAIRGAAGTGKTTLMREAVQAIEGQGTRVLVVAPSTGAVEVLRQDFPTAQTLQQLLVTPAVQQQLHGGVLWVDEAGLVGTRQLAAVCALVERSHARLILAGDPRQHHAVERGDALELLQRYAHLQPVEVTEVQRQRGAYKRAVTLLSQGRVAEGWQQLEALGCLREVPDATRYQHLADDYLATIQAGQTALVIAPTHREGTQVTAALREGLRTRGRLTGEDHPLTRLTNLHWTTAERGDAPRYEAGQVVQFVQHAPWYRKGTRLWVTGHDAKGQVLAVAAGDRVVTLPLAQAARFQVYTASPLPVAVGDTLRITQNGTTRDGHALVNGARHTVAAIMPTGDLRLSNGWVVDRAYGHLTHGYVLTSHAAQGQTVDRVLLAASATSLAAASAEQFYVSVSRGREGVTLYTEDQAALRAAVLRSDARLSATALTEDQTVQAHRARASRYARVMTRLHETVRTLGRWVGRELDRLLTPAKEPSYER